MNMKHSFRTSLWMFLLLGCLQANPIRDAIILISRLTDEVTCGTNVTFVSPKISTTCQAEALQAIKDGLHNATRQCEGKNQFHWTNDTLETLENTPFQIKTSSTCNWENPHRKPFSEFVQDCKRFIQFLNSAAA